MTSNSQKSNLNNKHCIVVIPARWGSTRFPGKSLHAIAGRPLVQHVWERCLRARLVKRVVIATDDRRIQDVAEAFGAEVVMTSKRHQSGTDRMAEVAEHLEKQKTAPAYFINVQGDEPLIDARLIDRLAKTMLQDPQVEMITAATPLKEEHQRNYLNLVKAVINRHGNALYFSRSPIPFHRDAHDPKSAVVPLLHLGIYGFRRDILKLFVSYRPSPLERCEKLEQLRALENGISIRVLTTSHQAWGVDTPEDAKRLEALLKRS
ncbi:MAG: 3-deoxy-manno-octulosonate cytidylyltransferase [Chthoniobacterales bacterium]|nr:3-deoxy-manno-octulosonate cytidylyltransferase [Chthoniobacterales bacterium]